MRRASALAAFACAIVFVGMAATPAPGATARNVVLKAPFGYISIPIVKAPARGKCVSVPVKVDVRNAANVPDGGINVGIKDDFDNLTAYAEWSQFVDVNGALDVTQKKPNGVYVQPMRVCRTAQTWQDPYRPTVSIDLTPYSPKSDYEFVAVGSFEHESQGSAAYSFK